MKYQRNPQATATICLVVWLCVLVVSTEAFKSSRHVHMVPSRKAPAPPLFMVQYDDDDSNKFGFGQRIESLKSFVVGALTGSLTLAPIVGVHDVVFRNHGLAQFEFDSDTAALEAGLFAMVYRYCIRTDDNNPQLGQGVVGAFALTRTCSRIVVPSYCTAIPLNCGGPLGYLDWEMLGQIAANGLESAVLFGATGAAISYCMERGYISRFPG